jgi:RNA-directed DNA polymerase
VLDRLIQQAIVQVLTPLFDPNFSESSYGFRPQRSTHRAVKQVQRTIRRGLRYAVDMDLSKFFDRVQHNVLMARIARRVDDKMLTDGNNGLTPSNSRRSQWRFIPSTA